MPAAAAKIEQAVADDVIERQSQWAARTTVEIGEDIAERVTG
jgi:3-isopropylmalate dehydrogenase